MPAGDSGAGGSRSGARALRPSLFRDRAFRRYWAGQSASALGDAFALVALPLLVLESTGSVTAMGLVSATFAAAQVVAGLVSGPIIDRFDRRRLMVACDLIRCAVYTVIPVLWFTRGPTLWALVVVTALGGAFGNLFQVGYVTATPALVPRERLTEANGYLQGSQALTYVVGPILAGLVASGTGAAAAIGIDAATFALSAWTLAGLRFRSEPVRAPVEAGGKGPGASAGLRFLLREPTLRSVTIAFMLISLLSSPAGTVDVLIFHLRSVLGRGDSTVGTTLGLSAVGGVVGALLASRVRRRFSFGAAFVGATAIQGAALLAMGRGALWMLVAGGCVWTGTEICRAVITQTFRQEITPDEILGRATAAFWTLSAVAAPLGTALITVCAQRFGTGRTLTGSGVCLVLISALLLLTPLRRGSRVPAAR